MNGKEEFKTFVKENPKLIKYVRDGSKTWQNFYEIFNLYGKDSNAWKEYLGEETASASAGLDLISWLKNIDLDSIQDGIASIQRVLGVVQDFTNKDQSTNIKEEYKPRPLYKHFED